MATAKAVLKKANAALASGDQVAAFTIAAEGDKKGAHLQILGYYQSMSADGSPGPMKGPRYFTTFQVRDRVDPKTGELYHVLIGYDSFAQRTITTRLDRWVDGGWEFVENLAKAGDGREVLFGVMEGQTEGRFIDPVTCGVPRTNKITGKPLVDSEGNAVLTKSYDELVADTDRWLPASKVSARVGEDAPEVVIRAQHYS